MTLLTDFLLIIMQVTEFRKCGAQNANRLLLRLRNYGKP